MQLCTAAEVYSDLIRCRLMMRAKDIANIPVASEANASKKKELPVQIANLQFL